MTHRFKEVQVFTRATHCVGVLDFMVLKELPFNWRRKVDVEWRKMTDEDIRRVKPDLHGQPQTNDVTSPSKMKTMFIAV